jgi:ADP-ribose pyrophosphatase YjhB (NUDIX family)
LETSALHSVSVAAVITNDAGDVLLIQRRDNGHWEPPGGVLELDESIVDGLRREVNEETGLEIGPGRLTGVYKNIAQGIVALVFRASGTGIPAESTDESARVAWVAPEDIAGLCEETYAVRVLDALTEGSPRVRTHDALRILA